MILTVGQERETSMRLSQVRDKVHRGYKRFSILQNNKTLHLSVLYKTGPCRHDLNFFAHPETKKLQLARGEDQTVQCSKKNQVSQENQPP